MNQPRLIFKAALAVLLILLFCLSARANDSCVAAPAGMIAWWAGENDPGDKQGSNNATFEGVMGYTPGKKGSAFSFRGTNSTLSFGNGIGNFGLGNFTIEFWIQTTSIRGEGVMCKRDDCLDGSFFDIRMGVNGMPGTLTCELDGDAFGGNHNFIRTVGTVNDGNFHHVALVREGTALKVFLDGELDSSNSTPSVTLIANEANFVAGRSACTGIDGVNYFTGKLDEISIYNRAASIGEIRAIYQAGTAGKCGAGPTILRQPANQSASPGASVIFSVQAIGTAPVKYQWRFNGRNILGATKSSLTLNNINLFSAGGYSVMVSNPFGSVPSAIGSLKVKPPSPPAIVLQPVDQFRYFFSTALTIFTVKAQGSASMQYQWYFNGQRISGASSPNLILTAANARPGYYSVQVRNNLGSALSARARLLFVAPPPAPSGGGTITYLYL